LTFKKINILLFPYDITGIKQFRIPRFAIFLFIFFFLSGFTFLCWIIPNYRMIRDQMSQLNRLEAENKRKENEFAYFAERIHEMALKISEFKELDHRLKVMANFKLEGYENDGHFPGVGGPKSTLLMTDFSGAKTVKELVPLMHRTLDDLKEVVAASKKEKRMLHRFFKEQRILLATTPSICPTQGWLSSRFGYRISPFTGKRDFHRGIDISTRSTTPVIAPANGLVSSVRWNELSGNVLTIKHGYRFETIYAHLHKILVKRGQEVNRGEKIALVGNTGLSTGPHLHYEVHIDGVAVDPLKYF